MTSHPGTGSTAATDETVDTKPPRRSRGGFFRSRWDGEVPLGHLLGLDMLVYGTIINVTAALLGLLALAADLPTVVGVLLYFSPLPYNLFLVSAVWRSAVAADEPWRSGARVAALLWLTAATFV